jgi:hypothetical protein
LFFSIPTDLNDYFVEEFIGEQNDASTFCEVAKSFFEWIQSFQIQQVLLVSHDESFKRRLFFFEVQRNNLVLEENWNFGNSFELI